jgi:hypothetical protein
MIKTGSDWPLRLAVAFLVFSSVALPLNSCSAQGLEQARPTHPTVQRYFTAVRDEYSGQRARELVAFVESFWRLAGNEGFNASISKVVEVLEAAGYVPEDRAARSDRLTYRIERREMERATWEPVNASLTIVGASEPLLEYATNRNMVAVYSHSTPPGGVEAEVVFVGRARPEDFAGVDVRGKIVFGETRASHLFEEAVRRRGALGVLSYSMPAFNQAERFRNAIQFGRIPNDPEARSWGVRLSHAAREAIAAALESGPVSVRVEIESRIYESEELTLVAEVRGTSRPDERFVFSAHVQEPGANDNASGVGALAEAARVAGALVRAGTVSTERTITFLWGDEIRSTRRFLEEDSARAAGVMWGLSLDMVGEDTRKTGGTFLIEKMPDPSAVWTRGQDQHTEWGGNALDPDDLTPHYLNDFILNRCLDQGEEAGWVVGTNPFEGGSDHVPFLRAGKPGVLLWHFTDVFYHTDLDRLENVSAATLRNVGICATVAALTLTSADREVTLFLLEELERAAQARLEAEYALSRDAVEAGEDREGQTVILQAWTEWYRDAVRMASDIQVGGAEDSVLQALEDTARRVERVGEEYVQRLAEVARG